MPLPERLQIEGGIAFARERCLLAKFLQHRRADALGESLVIDAGKGEREVGRAAAAVR